MLVTMIDSALRSSTRFSPREDGFCFVMHVIVFV